MIPQPKVERKVNVQIVNVLRLLSYASSTSKSFESICAPAITRTLVTHRGVLRLKAAMSQTAIVAIAVRMQSGMRSGLRVFSFT